MKKLFILNVTKRFELNIHGGVENVVDTLCSKLTKYNIISDVFTIKINQTKKKKYKIFSSQRNFEIFSTPISFNSLLKFYKISKNYNFLIFHFPWPFMDILSLLVPGRKIVILYHADIIQKNLMYYIYLPFKLLFFYRSNKIICSSEEIVKSNKFLLNYKSKIKIIPFGINQKIISCNNLKYSKFKFYKYFIFVGNLREYKGLIFLIDTFKYLPNCKLVIVGDGILKDRIKKKIKSSNNIFYIGNLENDDKFFLIKNSIALILPSLDRREAFGISLMEAASLGVPMISTKLGTGTTFINRDGFTGYVVLPKDRLNLKKAILNLQNDKKTRDRFSINAFLRYKKFFSEKKMLNSYQLLIKNLN